MEKNQEKKKRKKLKENITFEKKYFQPNYFVGIQVSNPVIHRAFVDVQKVMLSCNKSLYSTLVDVATLHITLLVTHVATEDELHIVCSALDHCGETLSRTLSDPPLCLTFRGISHFSNQTIFAKVVEDDQYARLISAADFVRGKFSEMGVILPDKRELLPHLTIAKLSKVPRGKKKRGGLTKIEPYLYESELNKEFGKQKVSGLQFLSMNKTKNEKRYYFIERESLFDFVPNESSDHCDCCFPRQPPTPYSCQGINPNISSTPNGSFKRLGLINSLSSSRSYTLIGGVALLSFAFALSRWLNKK